MKELSIEEKAKAYDEAIEKAKNCLKDCTITNIAISYIETIFPELKESEDEKIRKALIHMVTSNKELHFGINNYNGVIWEDILAWLEKQGKKESQVKCPTFTFDDILALQCCMETVKKVQKDKDLYEKLNDLHGRVYDAYHFEKGEVFDKIVERARTGKQRVLVTESDGVANIDWDTRSLQDTKLLMEYGLNYIKKIESKGEQKPVVDSIRRIEIEKAAFYASGIIEQEEWFIKGAEWADEHPYCQ